MNEMELKRIADAISNAEERMENEIQKAADAMTNAENAEERRENEIQKAADAFSKIDMLNQSEYEYIEAKISGHIKSEKQYGDLTVIEISGKQYKYGVKRNGKFIVPFGIYGWIEGFDKGLSRVRTYGLTGYTHNITAVFDDDFNVITDRKVIEEREAENRKNHPERYAKWGIIDENGKEVLPTEYDEIWKFFGKDRLSTTAVKGDMREEIFFHDLDPSIPLPDHYITESHGSDDDYFKLSDCYDYEGNFDYERLEDAILDGEYVPEDW